MLFLGRRQVLRAVIFSCDFDGSNSTVAGEGFSQDVGRRTRHNPAPKLWGDFRDDWLVTHEEKTSSTDPSRAKIKAVSEALKDPWLGAGGGGKDGVGGKDGEDGTLTLTQASTTADEAVEGTFAARWSGDPRGGSK